MELFIGVISNVFEVAGPLIAFWYTLRTAKVIKGLFVGWGLTIICVGLVAVVFPAIIFHFNKQYALYFPDAPAVVLVVFTGWFPASIAVILAWILRKSWNALKQSHHAKN